MNERSILCAIHQKTTFPGSQLTVCYSVISVGVILLITDNPLNPLIIYIYIQNVPGGM